MPATAPNLSIPIPDAIKPALAACYAARDVYLDACKASNDIYAAAKPLGEARQEVLSTLHGEYAGWRITERDAEYVEIFRPYHDSLKRQYAAGAQSDAAGAALCAALRTVLDGVTLDKGAFIAEQLIKKTRIRYNGRIERETVKPATCYVAGMVSLIVWIYADHIEACWNSTSEFSSKPNLLRNKILKGNNRVDLIADGTVMLRCWIRHDVLPVTIKGTQP